MRQKNSQMVQGSWGVRIFTILLSMILLLTYMPAYTWAAESSEDLHDITIEDWVYDVIDGKAKLTSYIGSAENLVVPEKIGDYPVTLLGHSMLEDNQTVRDLTIPGSVTEMESGAFYSDVLTTLRLEGTCTVIDESYRMDGDALKTVVYGPDSEKPLSYQEGDPCLLTTVQSYEVNGNNKYLAAVDGVLFSKDMTVLYRYPDMKKGETYEIPDTVTKICNDAFRNTRYLANIYVPASVTQFEGRPFQSNIDYESSNYYKIITPVGSAAAAFAEKNHIRFEEVEENLSWKSNSSRTVAESGAKKWNGTKAEEVTPVNATYTIRNAAQLKWVSDQVAAGHSFRDETIILGANINLNGNPWTPIGNVQKPFRGNFDGQYHTISGLKLDGKGEIYQGLFGLIDAYEFRKITIKNVKLKNVSADYYNKNGATGCLIGFAVAYRGASVTVRNVSVQGELEGCVVGGVIGKVDSCAAGSSVKVQNAVSHTNIEATGTSGGIIGSAILETSDSKYESVGNITVKDCKYRGQCYISGRTGYAGGIIGTIEKFDQDDKLLIEHCLTEGSISGFNPSGGIVGELPNGAVVKSCVNYASVSAYDAGGIVGHNYGEIRECFNGGEISAATGGSNAGLSGENDGTIYDSYNAGSTPTSSSLAYAYAISGGGSGLIQNCYNIGYIDKGVQSSIAYSVPGIFGFTYGQTVRHSYYDNSLEEKFYGSGLDDCTIVNDPDNNIIDSGGMSTAAMKTMESYNGWDFRDIWEFDYYYSRGYPTLTSIKDLLKMDPDSSNKKLAKNVFKFTVVDQNATPVKEATITVAQGTSDEASVVTDKLGMANMQRLDGEIGIVVTKDHYLTYQDASFKMNKKGEMTIMIILEDLADQFPVRSAIMDQDIEQDGNTNHFRYELLTQERTINRQWSSSNALLPGTTYLPFSIRATLSNPTKKYTKAELIQDTADGINVIATAENPMIPLFKNLEYDSFVSTQKRWGEVSLNQVKIRLTADVNGSEEVTTQPINLTVDDEKDLQGEVSFDGGISIEIPTSNPAFGGRKLEIPVCEAPFSIKVNDETVEFGINLNDDGFKFGENGGFDHDKPKGGFTLKEDFEKLSGYFQDPSSALALNGMNPVKIGWKVIGYGSSDLPLDGKVKLKLYVQLSVTISGETQFLYVGVLALDGKGSVNADGSIKLDLTSSKLLDLESGEINLGGSIGFHVFVGAGLANAAAIGVYGGPTFGLKYALVSADHRGLEEAYVEGDVSVAVRVLGSNVVEVPFLDDRYDIYNWDATNDDESQKKRAPARNLMAVMQDMSDSPITVSDEAAAGTWTGGAETLQASAYSGSSPVIMNCSGDRILLFCSNTNTSRAAADRSMLMYSVYDAGKGSWGEPQAVADDGTADFNVSASGKYIVWNNSKSSLAECKTYADLSKLQEVCVAEYDSTDKTFKNRKTITDNNRYENRLQISGGSDPIITWTVDENDNIFGLGGTNTFYSASLNGSEWEITSRSSTDSAILCKTNGKIDGGNQVFYVIDEDGDLRTANDEYLYVDDGSGSAQKVCDFSVSQVTVTEAADKILFTDMYGNLYSLTSLDSQPKQEFSDGRMSGQVFIQTVSDENGNLSLITTNSSGNNRNASVIRYNAAKGTWSQPVALTDQTDYVEGVAAYYEGDELCYVYNQRKVTLARQGAAYGETNSLHFVKKDTGMSGLTISSVDFLRNQVINGNDLPLSVYVNNSGMKNLDSVAIKITSGSDSSLKTHVDTTVDTGVVAGGSAKLSVALPLASDAVKTTYQVTVSDPSDPSVSSTAAITVGEPNYKLEKSVYLVNAHPLVTVSITNTGFEAGSGTLEFYDENDPDLVLDSYSFSALAPDEFVTYTFKPEAKKLLFSSLRIGIRIIDKYGNVISDSRQAQLWKEAVLPVTAVCLDQNVAELAKAGDTLQLNAAVRPAEAAAKASLQWESSDPTVATVDENGLVKMKKDGCALITVCSEDKQYYDECQLFCGKMDLSNCEVTKLKSRYAYTGDSITPTFKVKYGSYTLQNGQDYSYELTDNESYGEAHLTINGKGRFSGKIEKTFMIVDSDKYDLPSPTDMKLDLHEMTLLTEEDEDTWYLEAIFTPDADSIADAYVYWSSSDETVATVDEYGTVRAVGPGTCVITARSRDGGLTDTCNVTVKGSVYASDISVFPNEDTLTMNVDDVQFIYYDILPENATDQEIWCESSDDSIVTAGVQDNEIVLYGHAKGQATITLQSSDGRVEKSFNVKVVDMNQLKFDVICAFLEVGDEYTTTVQEGDDVYYGAVTYTSSDPSIATVNSHGTVYAKKAGDVKITASGTYNGSSFKIYTYFRISEGSGPVDPGSPIEEIYLNPVGSSELYEDGTLQLIATFKPADPRNTELDWESDDPDIATVDDTGLVTGVSKGTTYIRAIALDGNAEGVYKVTVKGFVEPTDITIDPSETEMKVGQTMPVTVTLEPEDATDNNVELTSSDEDVVTCYFDSEEQQWYIVGKGAGSAVVTAETSNGFLAECEVTVTASHDLADARISMSEYQFVYDGTDHCPKFTVSLNGVTLREGVDYKYEYHWNRDAGFGNVEITGIGSYSGSVYGFFIIDKADQPMTAKGKAPKIRFAKLKKKAQTIKKSNAFSVKDAQGTVTFKKLSGNKKFTVKKNGTIVVKKKTKKGTYKLKVSVIAAGNDNYERGTQTVTVTVKIK